MNLLIKKIAAKEQPDIFRRIIHNICKITVTVRYFSSIYISYQMYKTWSCVTFHHSFPQANDNRITGISTSWKRLNIEVLCKVYMVSFWTELFWIFWIFVKKVLLKTKKFMKIVLTNKKILNIFKNVLEKTQKFQSHLSRLVLSKTKILSVGQPCWPTFFRYLAPTPNSFTTATALLKYR